MLRTQTRSSAFHNAIIAEVSGRLSDNVPAIMVGALAAWVGHVDGMDVAGGSANSRDNARGGGVASTAALNGNGEDSSTHDGLPEGGCLLLLIGRTSMWQVGSYVAECVSARSVVVFFRLSEDCVAKSRVVCCEEKGRKLGRGLCPYIGGREELQCSGGVVFI